MYVRVHVFESVHMKVTCVSRTGVGRDSEAFWVRARQMCLRLRGGDCFSWWGEENVTLSNNLMPVFGRGAGRTVS